MDLDPGSSSDPLQNGRQPWRRRSVVAGMIAVTLLQSVLTFIFYRGRVVSHWSLADSDLFVFALPVLIAYVVITFLLFRSPLFGPPDYPHLGPAARAVLILGSALVLAFFSTWVSMLLPINIFGV